MDIVSEAQHEVLTFVAACNRNYYNPTGSQVELWRSNRTPIEAVYNTVRRRVSDGTGALANLQTATERIAATIVASLAASGLGSAPIYEVDRELVTPAETVIRHLVRLTWLEEVSEPGDEDPGLRLTDLGRALLRDADSGNDREPDFSVVLLGREDPLAYPILIGQLGAAGPGLLVDPYLKLADLHTIVVSTQLTRLLVSGKQNTRAVVGSMAAYLGSRSLSRRVEVRSSVGLHDRVLIADDGDVITVGTSLNGVGRTTTVMSPVPSPARESLRDEYERLWADATLVNPESDERQTGDGSELADIEPGQAPQPSGGRNILSGQEAGAPDGAVLRRAQRRSPRTGHPHCPVITAENEFRNGVDVTPAQLRATAAECHAVADLSERITGEVPAAPVLDSVRGRSAGSDGHEP